jgi:hypothetical protein
MLLIPLHTLNPHYQSRTTPTNQLSLFPSFFLCIHFLGPKTDIIMHTTTYLASLLALGASTAFARPAPTGSFGGRPAPTGAPSDRFGDRVGDYIEDGLDRFRNWTGPQRGQQNCMSEEDALMTANTFQSLIQGYTIEQALAALTPDFVDHTSAVSIIINRGGSGPENLTEPVFTSREEFMQGHGTQEPIP